MSADEKLGHKLGFRSRKPSAMTHAERQSKYRRSRGIRQLQLDLTADMAASIVYIRQQWGMSTNKEAAEAAIRFLAICTRRGLQRLPQSIED